MGKKKNWTLVCLARHINKYTLFDSVFKMNLTSAIHVFNQQRADLTEK